MRCTDISMTVAISTISDLDHLVHRLIKYLSFLQASIRLVFSPCMLIHYKVTVCNMKQLQIFRTKQIQIRTASLARKQSWEFSIPWQKNFFEICNI